MKTFNDSPEMKEKLLQVLREARENDKYIQGRYWDSETKCGCLIGHLSESVAEIGEITYGGNLERYDVLQDYVGLPCDISNAADDVFEGLSLEQAKLWSEEFLTAIPVGVSYGFDNDFYYAYEESAEDVKTKLLRYLAEGATNEQ